MSYMKRTIDVENQDDAWMSDFEADMAYGELPDTSHWPAIKHLAEKISRVTTSDAWMIAELIEDRRYMGPAAERFRSAEKALREAARELFIASGELG
jgi:hypothetical protein